MIAEVVVPTFTLLMESSSGKNDCDMADSDLGKQIMSKDRI